MSERASPFSARAVLLVLLVGAGAFLLFLLAIAKGWDGSNEQTGTAHAAATGLQGYSAFVELLEETGAKVEISRSEGRFDEEGLLILTPAANTDAEELLEIVNDRRYVGPTILILPKWFAVPAGKLASGADAPRGWTRLESRYPPLWLDDFDASDIRLEGRANDAADRRLPQVGIEEQGLAAKKPQPGPQYAGLGLEGRLPVTPVQWFESSDLSALVSDSEDRMLVGFVGSTGTDTLDMAAGYDIDRTSDAYTYEADYPLIVVSEPDLLNNLGMADKQRALLALALVRASLDGQDQPIIFDMVVPGYGRSQNLLTLAFEPPFLAATLCLLLAAVVIAWRGFLRYGPPRLAGAEAAPGKAQLVANAGALIERAGRFHLLGGPYATLIGARIARSLALRMRDGAERSQRIDAVLARRGSPASFIDAANAMRGARTPRELLRAARALKAIERTLAK